MLYVICYMLRADYNMLFYDNQGKFLKVKFVRAESLISNCH